MRTVAGKAIFSVGNTLFEDFEQAKVFANAHGSPIKTAIFADGQQVTRLGEVIEYQDE